MIHWVIGNGESRKNIDISKLEGVTYGAEDTDVVAVVSVAKEEEPEEEERGMHEEEDEDLNRLDGWDKPEYDLDELTLQPKKTFYNLVLLVQFYVEIPFTICGFHLKFFF